MFENGKRPKSHIHTNLLALQSNVKNNVLTLQILKIYKACNINLDFHAVEDIGLSSEFCTVEADNKKDTFRIESKRAQLVGGGGSRTPVLTCRPAASTSLAAVLCFETVRASGRRNGF